jgi:uncharacterized protein (TIGR02594 family)
MSANSPAWLEEAKPLVGEREIKGTKHNPKIVHLWHDAHLSHVRDDETAWCAAFVGASLERAGYRSTRRPNARSYTTWGIDVMESGVLHVPLGAILVFSRPPSEWMGHVAFAVGYNKHMKILALGGNQSDRVSVSPFDPGRVIAARMPIEMKADTNLLLLRRIPELDIVAPVSTNEA